MATKKISELTNKEAKTICFRQFYKHIREIRGYLCSDCPLNYRGNCLKKLIRTINYNKGCLDTQVEVEE